MSQHTRIAVVMVVRNGESQLASAMASILAQTLVPHDVIIVVGPSSDGTYALAEQLARASRGVRVCGNPAGDRASGINIALDASDADVIALVDAQARLDVDYLRAGLTALEKTDAGVVGGPMDPIGTTPIGRSVAAALASRIGIGNARFIPGGAAARLVDAVNLGIYRTSTFATIGKFNPALLRTEDDDMFARMRDAGIGIWLDPTIRSTYFCRQSFSSLSDQFYGYGYWKVALATIRPHAVRVRHLVPAGFVLVFVVAFLVSIAAWWPPVVIVLVAYGLLLSAVAVRAPLPRRSERLLVPLAVATIHFSYGWGTLLGILHWRRLRDLARAGAQATKASVDPLTT